MCNVKEGINVKTQGDLQNLVTSVILRQTTEFTLQDVIQRANARLTGSKYFESKELNERCEDTLECLFRLRCVSFNEGKYKLTMSFPSVNKR